MAGVLSAAFLSGKVLENHQQLPQRQEVLDTAKNHGKAFGGKGTGEGKGGTAGGCGRVVLENFGTAGSLTRVWKIWYIILIRQ